MSDSKAASQLESDRHLKQNGTFTLVITTDHAKKARIQFIVEEKKLMSRFRLMFPSPAFLTTFAQCITEDSEEFIQHPHFSAEHQAHLAKCQGPGVDAA